MAPGVDMGQHVKVDPGVDIGPGVDVGQLMKSLFSSSPFHVLQALPRGCHGWRVARVALPVQKALQILQGLQLRQRRLDGCERTRGLRVGGVKGGWEEGRVFERGGLTSTGVDDGWQWLAGNGWGSWDGVGADRGRGGGGSEFVGSAELVDFDGFVGHVQFAGFVGRKLRQATCEKGLYREMAGFRARDGCCPSPIFPLPSPHTSRPPSSPQKHLPPRSSLHAPCLSCLFRQPLLSHYFPLPALFPVLPPCTDSRQAQAAA
eukprot:363756-Chlamydomonas_euryale.AAC.10